MIYIELYFPELHYSFYHSFPIVAIPRSSILTDLKVKATSKYYWIYLQNFYLHKFSLHLIK